MNEILKNLKLFLLGIFILTNVYEKAFTQTTGNFPESDTYNTRASDKSITSLSAEATEVTVEFVEDDCYNVNASYINGSSTWTSGINFGSDERTGIGEKMLSVYNYDISKIPSDASIQNVEFHAYQHSSAWFIDSFTVDLRLLKEGFDENSVTWNSHAESIDTTTGGLLSTFSSSEEHFLEGDEYFFQSSGNFTMAVQDALSTGGDISFAIIGDRLMWLYSDDVQQYPRGKYSPLLKVTYLGNPLSEYSISTKCERGIGGFKIEPECGPYLEGDTIKITADPDEGYSFKEWTAGVPNDQKEESQIVMIVNEDINVVGNFELNTGIPTQRGRVYIENGTIVSDKGTRLRGCYVDTYYWKSDQSQIQEGTKDSIMVLAEHYGFNALHFYMGSKEDETGKFLQLADSIVKWTRQSNLYLVMCIGGGTENGSFSIEKVRDFWNLYAPRYAQETHVIYEIQNEPEFNCNAPSSEETLNMEIEAFNIIRDNAPETHVLLMSYGMVNRYYDEDIAVLEEAGINLKTGNASIAYHGYHWCAKARQNVPYPGGDEVTQVKSLKDEGYSFINTEFESDSTLEGSFEHSGRLLDFYENEMEVSWLAFWHIPGNSIGPKFIEGVEEMGTTWCPDYGTWPQNSATCLEQTYYQLNASSNDNGKITIYPEGSLFIDGTEITITAEPDNGYEFDGWTGDVPEGKEETNPLTITIDNNINIAANFKKLVSIGEFDHYPVKVFPNPAIDHVILSSRVDFDYIELFNVHGKRVLSKDVNSRVIKIDVLSLPAGVYFVQTWFNNRIITRKIIKE